MTVHVRRLAPPADDPEAFEAVVAFQRADDAVRDPGDPPRPRREIEWFLFGPHPRKQHIVWLAESEGTPVGMAWANTESDAGDEFQLALLELLVEPSHRRSGVGTALLRHAVPDLAAIGQNSLAAYPCAEIETEAAEAMCARYGLLHKQDERCSRAWVADIDADLLDSWVAAAPGHAPGYRLVRWQGPCPDDVAEAWCAAEAAMDDAPLDDFEYHRTQLDPEALRRDDEASAAAGFLAYRSLVLAPDGAPAGLSAIYVHEDRPQVAYQDDTGVLADHRGRRLGRWLKAANFRQLQAAHPDVAVIETYNAQSNPWMLSINIDMGFAPHHDYRAWQAPLDEVASRL